MADLETKLKKKVRNSKIQKIILTSLYTAGVLGVAALMPNTVSLLKYLDPNKKKKGDPRYRVNRVIARLRERGLVEWKETQRGVFLRLTKEGERAIDILERKEFKIQKPKKWDGKWRVIIFDIKENRRGMRDKFRRTLTQIGFLKLQQSVWVYPYNCEDLITLLKAEFKVGKDILYIIADSIENDKWIRAHFGILK
jgi:CRISPR-associated endonuclease Cas2